MAETEESPPSVGDSVSDMRASASSMAELRGRNRGSAFGCPLKPPLLNSFEIESMNEEF